MKHEIRNPVQHKNHNRPKAKKVNRSIERFLKNAKDSGYSIETHATGYWCFNPPRYFY